MIMKRFYSFWVKGKGKASKSSVNSKVREEALMQLRKTRSQFVREHPGLLENIKELHLKAQKQKLDETVKGPNIARSLQQDNDESLNNDGDIIIDRNKSLETALKFLELSGSKEAKEQIKKTLSDKLN